MYKIKILKKSSYYETSSYPNKENPKFINIVVDVESNLNQENLASVLLFVEEKLERKRLKKNDPRTCDIDILDFNSQIINFKYKELSFTVPHKKLTSRSFVLYPLQEILPDWIHPKTKDTINLLIEKLPLSEKNSILKIEKY
jgi:2-amino-4-hydroxy-6-hydroxymethyldihydropteridine diphosphokinase